SDNRSPARGEIGSFADGALIPAGSGLRSMRHRTGVLMPEQYELHRFHNWLRQRHETLQPKP
ncbi:MAG: hypothetical protein E5X56_34400, partial [Mesorhizobium sp.]|uniref:hypothetical protein n=1 Tax=Mesorhizobium sp. TaxID=1871066 RepID=UPI00121B21BA